jgi:3-phenylpropionate/trans-cinnamate dioxygenase ferredoxin component
VSGFVTVAAEGDVRPGHTRAVTAGTTQLLLCNVDGELCAIADVCSHDRGPLGEGRLRGATIECPRHGARFNVRDGTVVAPPAVVALATFPVRVVDGRVEVGVTAGEPR